MKKEIRLMTTEDLFNSLLIPIPSHFYEEDELDVKDFYDNLLWYRGLYYRDSGITSFLWFFRDKKSRRFRKKLINFISGVYRLGLLSAAEIDYILWFNNNKRSTELIRLLWKKVKKERNYNLHPLHWDYIRRFLLRNS